MEDKEIDVIIVFKAPVRQMNKAVAEKFMRDFSEKVGSEFENQPGVKVMVLTGKEDWDMYAIPLKAMREGKIQGDQEVINSILDRCKTILESE